MVEAFHKTCNVKHEIDIKRYGNVKSETDSCQCFCFGLSFRILSYSSLKQMIGFHPFLEDNKQGILQVFTCLNLGILLTLQQIKMGILHMNTFKRKIYSQLRLWKENTGNRKSKSRIDFLQRRGNKVCQLEVKSSVTCLPIFMVPFL